MKNEKKVRKAASTIAVAGLMSASGLAAPSLSEVEAVTKDLDLVRGSLSAPFQLESGVLQRVVGAFDGTLAQGHSQTHSQTHSMTHSETLFLV